MDDGYGGAMIMEMYEWQKMAYDKWSHNKFHGIAECPTGTGKSFFAIQCMKLFKQNTVIVVPTISILEQWKKTLLENEIEEKNIGCFFGSEKDEKSITITTIHSLPKLKNKYSFFLGDEIHHYSAEIFYTYVQEFFNRNKILYTLGISATASREDGLQFRIENLIGKVFYKLSMEEAQNYLNPYTIKNIPVSLTIQEQEEYNITDKIVKKNFKNFCGMSDILRTAKNWSDPRARSACALLKAVQKRKSVVCNSEEKIYKTLEIIEEYGKNEKIIVFNEFIKSGENLLKKLNKTQKKAVILRSKAKKKENNEMISKFETDENISVLLATRVADEGINLPTISVGIISSGNSTRRQSVQRLGRILRKGKNKKKSVLFQLYCQNTIDEKYVKERTKFIENPKPL